MKRYVSTWIEGNGTVRTVFRTLMLWVSPSEDYTKLQLLKIVQRQNGAPGPYILQFAIDRRRKENQWVWVYMPLFAFSALGILLLAAGLLSGNQRNVIVGLAFFSSLLVSFRATLYSLYLDTCYSVPPWHPASHPPGPSV